jgi:hypothetical protein
VVAAVLGVDAEKKPLEEIAPPLCAAPSGKPDG